MQSKHEYLQIFDCADLSDFESYDIEDEIDTSILINRKSYLVKYYKSTIEVY